MKDLYIKLQTVIELLLRVRNNGVCEKDGERQKEEENDKNKTHIIYKISKGCQESIKQDYNKSHIKREIKSQTLKR